MHSCMKAYKKEVKTSPNVYPDAKGLGEYA
jgi:hypothetical protein